MQFLNINVFFFFFQTRIRLQPMLVSKRHTEADVKSLGATGVPFTPFKCVSFNLFNGDRTFRSTKLRNSLKIFIFAACHAMINFDC